MNRIEFMNTLEQLLLDITKEEREDALQFYNTYFEDAGVENEGSVIEELGSPADVARTIKEDLGITPNESGEYTERGYQDERFMHRQPSTTRQQEGSSLLQRFIGWLKGLTPWQLMGMIVLLLLVIIPAVLPLFTGLITAVFSIVIAVLSVGFALFVTACAISVAGIAVVVTGVITVFAVPAAGISLIGVGLILSALGIIATFVMFRLCKWMYPKMFRMFIDVCRLPFRKRPGGES